MPPPRGGVAERGPACPPPVIPPLGPTLSKDQTTPSGHLFDPDRVTEPPRSADLGLRTPIPYRAVFEFAPNGMVIADARGHVQGANLAAKRMLGALLDRDRVRCCDLFDCRRAGTPLADRCITEMALEHVSPLPEVRVDLPENSGTAASAWISAAPYGGAEQSVILQLRAGVMGARRRRSEQHWSGAAAGPYLRIFT